jgi:hypothetical protein
MYGNGICCQYGAGAFKITVNGDAGAISSSGEFRDVVRKSFDVVGRNTGPTVDYYLDFVYDDYPYEQAGSVGDGMCCGYGVGSIALYAAADDSDVLITSSNGSIDESQTNVLIVGTTVPVIFVVRISSGQTRNSYDYSKRWFQISRLHDSYLSAHTVWLERITASSGA